MATLMDLIAGYSQGGAPVDDSSQSLGQAARDLYQGLINPKAWQEVKQATQRTTNIAPAVLESLARGSIAQVPGIAGDTSSLLRQLAPQTMQQIFGNRVAPTTEEILGYVPRATPAYQGSQEHEMVGGLLSPAMGYFAKALPLATKDMPIGNMIAYHGTPHEIQGGFDISKVGTGEGAQAYGHGMYFAESPKVAESYKGRTVFNEPTLDKFSNGPNYYTDSSGKHFKVRDYVKNDKPVEVSSDEYNSKFKEVLKLFNEQNQGNLYKVDIPDKDIPNMLDWDKPFNKQPKIVQDAFLNIAKNDPDLPLEFLIKGNATGGSLIQAMNKIKASKLLLEQNVPGIRYLDEGSRDWRILHPDEAVSGKWTVGKWPGGGKETKYFDTEQEAKDYFNQNQTKNFVVFDPKHVKILEKNNQKIGE